MTMKCFYLFIYGSCWVKCVPQSHSEEGGHVLSPVTCINSQLSHASFLGNSLSCHTLLVDIIHYKDLCSLLLLLQFIFFPFNDFSCVLKLKGYNTRGTWST